MTTETADPRDVPRADSAFWRLMTTPLGTLARGRITGRIDGLRSVLPSAAEAPASSLPPLVVEFIEAAVQRTRLWRSERADVARELAAHFRDGLDSGASEAFLIGSFGDRDRAAKLIRRAKKRNRPLVWHAWVRAWQAVGCLFLVCLAVYAVLAARYFSASPNIARNFSAELNARTLATPEDQRAWPLYRKAYMAMPVLPEWTMDANSSAGMTWPWVAFDDPEFPTAEAYVATLGPSLAMVREAAARPVFGALITDAEDRELGDAMARRSGRDRSKDPPAPAAAGTANPSMISILLPHLGQLRQAARDLAFDARAAAHRGDGALAAADIRALVGMSRQVGQESFLISKLVSVAILAVATETTREVVEKFPGSLSDEDLRALAHTLSAGDPRLDPSDLAGEWSFFEDLLQRIYSDDGRGDGRLTAEGMNSLFLYAAGPTWESYIGVGTPAQEERIKRNLAGPIVGAVLAGRKAMREEWESLKGEFLAEAAVPPWQWRSLPGTDSFARRDTAIWRARYIPINIVAPAMGRVTLAFAQARATRDATLVALALEVYKRRAGHYPQSLDELVPALLPAVPTDMFTGRPLLYRLTERGPVIYSAGNDRDDDGGRLPEGFPESGVHDPKAWVPPDAAFSLSPSEDTGVVRYATNPSTAVSRDGDWVLYPIVRKPWVAPEP